MDQFTVKEAISNVFMQDHLVTMTTHLSQFESEGIFCDKQREKIQNQGYKIKEKLCALSSMRHALHNTGISRYSCIIFNSSINAT